MDLECYGKKFGRLDKCRICEYVDYCRSAGDPALISNVSYDDVAYSEKIAQSPAKTQKTEDEQNKGRAAGCGADDTPVLQEEGGQQGVMSFL